MQRTALTLMASLLACAAVTAQILPQPNGLLVIESNAPDATVVVDSRVIGAASDGPFALQPGLKQVVLVESAADGWAPRRSSGSVAVVSNQTVTLQLDLAIRYRIDSLPPDAHVVLRSDRGEEVLGATPLIVDRPEAMEGVLVARSAGFMPAEVSPGDSLFNRHTLILNPLLDGGSELDAVTTWIPPNEPRRWIDYAAASLALAAAGVAIYYKFEADAVDDRYRSEDSLERGDPLLKQEAERLDLYSLGALGVMQAGITVLAVRFVLR